MRALVESVIFRPAGAQNLSRKQREFNYLALTMRRQAQRRLTISKFSEGDPMYIGLAIILLLVWLFCFFLFHVTFFLIHLLLVFAVIAFILHFVMGRRAV
jgi:hypothetical protein